MSQPDSQPTDPMTEPLTRREREVLALLAEGLSAPEIAKKLTLAVSSVKWYVQQLYGKLGVNSKHKALVRAAELGLLQPPPAAPEPSPRAATPQAVAASPKPPSPSSAPASRHNLPLQLTNFIGREQQVPEVRRLLKTTRLVTLTGPGGTGKTRLALQIAGESLDDFADGAWLVELAPIADPALAPQAVAQALAVRVEGSELSGAVDDGPRDALTLVVDHVRDRRLLLVLDNCEHIVAACAELAEHLLRAAPGLRILATSREALGVAGERSYPVPALSLPDPGQVSALESLAQSEAVQLFVECALAARPDFTLAAENAPAVVQICRRLDGIPLAIILAAARTRALTAEQIAALLDDRFRLLTGGSRTAPPRQQTLRGAIDWSYDLLSEAERALLRRLSVFAGGATVEAAEHMLGTPDALDWLTQLVAKSLVLSIQQPGLEARFTLLETIREYAHDRLVEAGEAELARARHLAYYLALAEEAEPALRGHDQLTWLNRLDREFDNLQAALTFAVKQAEAEIGLRLACALTSYWSMRDRSPEGRRWLEAGLDLHNWQAANRPSPLLAKALLNAGWLNMRADLPASLARLEAALACYQELGDPIGMARAQMRIGIHRRAGTDFAEALEMLQAAYPTLLAAGDMWSTANCLHYMGHAIEEGGGEHARSQEYYQRSLALFRQLGDRWEQTGPLHDLARQAWGRGDFAAGNLLFEESAAIGVEVGDRSGTFNGLNQRATLLTEQGRYAEAMVLINTMDPAEGPRNATTVARMGEVEYLQGHLDEAARLYETAFELWRVENERHGQAWPLARLGCIAYRRGDLDRAARLLEQSLDHLGTGGWHWNRALVQLVQGDIARARGQYTSAASLYRKSLALIGSDARDVPDRLEAFAKLAGAAQQFERAARMLGAASAMRERLSVPIPPVERADHEAGLAQLRARLDPAAFEAAWSEGQALSSEQAVALAMDAGADPKGL